MPTMIHNGKLWITVNEVMSLMIDFRNDMENKREGCLSDIKKLDLVPIVKDMAIDLTNQDYDMFIETLEHNVKNYNRMIMETAAKRI